jgi:hypothetical protein
MKCEIKIESMRRPEGWTLTSYYCPHCAAKTVWESEDGDYYGGTEFLCVTCEGAFRSPTDPKDGPEVKERMERAKAIREADHIQEPSDAISPPASSIHGLS